MFRSHSPTFLLPTTAIFFFASLLVLLSIIPSIVPPVSFAQTDTQTDAQANAPTDKTINKTDGTSNPNKNFGISLISTYTVTETGRATVEQTFTLTNKKPDVYATQYALETSSTKISHITVKENQTDLKANIVTTDKKTSIGITFPDKIVGEGKKRQFTVRFEDESAVVANGNVLEVYVPKLSNKSEFESAQVRIVVPAKYGLPTRVLPADYTHQENQGNNTITLVFNQRLEEGVAALFGREQAYGLTLHYHLENPTTTTGIIQIALPPDTSHQRVWYEQLSPLPKTIEKDEDGNWIATYEIAAQKNIEVTARATAVLSLPPFSEVRVPEPLSTHTTTQPYWESHDAKIQELAKQYSTPKAIYTYVVQTLNYNYNNVSAPTPRLGAVQALAQPNNSVCQEFTDVFIAIARAAGIPTRRATGYAFTNNARLRPLSVDQEVLHAWPEYYDAERKVWVAVDPTWGNTTGGLNYFDQFDVNHVVFAYNGVSSTQPYGAGAYKKKDEHTRDVEVRVVEDAALPPPTLTAEIKPLSWYQSLSGNTLLGNTFLLTTTNTSGIAAYDIPIVLSAVNKKTQQPFALQAPSSLETILPFQTRESPLTLLSSPWWLSGTTTLTLQVGPVASQYDLSFGPLKPEVVFPISVGVCVVTGTLITWGVLVRRRRRYAKGWARR